jgi:uncharacterized membrane protein
MVVLSMSCVCCIMDERVLPPPREATGCGGGDSTGIGRPVTIPVPGGGEGMGGPFHMAVMLCTDVGIIPTARPGPDGGGMAMPFISSSCSEVTPRESVSGVGHEARGRA